MLTTNQGVAIADNQNSLKAGVRGPALLEDFILREKITHFDHERIPERIVHARGSARTAISSATSRWPRHDPRRALQGAGKRTPVFVRFSTVAGERGSKDTARDAAALPSSSTPTRATGTWWATTSPCSSSRTP
jgi:catalase